MILVVDDERSVADTLAEVFRFAGYASRAVYGAEEALALLSTLHPALLVTDVVMPGMNGVELAVQVHTRHPEIKILLVSGNAATQDVVEAAEAKGYRFELLAKPIPARQMLAKVASLLSDQA